MDVEDSEARHSADHVAEMVHCLFDKRVVFHSEDGDVALCPAWATRWYSAVRVPTNEATCCWRLTRRITTNTAIFSAGRNT